MKRNHFLVLAAIVPGIFGSVMMVTPEVMLANSLTSDVDASTRAVTQWVGFGAFSLGWINFLSRNDPGSPALRAVLIGNVLFHALGIVFDTYDYSAGLMRLSGLVSGLVPHGLLAIGFVYYLLKSPGPDWRSGGR